MMRHKYLVHLCDCHCCVELPVVAYEMNWTLHVYGVSEWVSECESVSYPMNVFVCVLFSGCIWRRKLATHEIKRKNQKCEQLIDEVEFQILFHLLGLSNSVNESPFRWLQVLFRFFPLSPFYALLSFFCAIVSPSRYTLTALVNIFLTNLNIKTHASQVEYQIKCTNVHMITFQSSTMREMSVCTTANEWDHVCVYV